MIPDFGGQNRYFTKFHFNSVSSLWLGCTRTLTQASFTSDFHTPSPPSSEDDITELFGMVDAIYDQHWEPRHLRENMQKIEGRNFVPSLTSSLTSFFFPLPFKSFPGTLYILVLDDNRPKRITVERLGTFLTRHLLACLVKEDSSHWLGYICRGMQVLRNLCCLVSEVRALRKLLVDSDDQRKCLLDVIVYVMVKSLFFSFIFFVIFI